MGRGLEKYSLRESLNTPTGGVRDEPSPSPKNMIHCFHLPKPGLDHGTSIYFLLMRAGKQLLVIKCKEEKEKEENSNQNDTEQ